MPFVPFPTGTMQSTIRMTLNSIACVMTQGWVKTPEGVATHDDGQAVADAIADWITSNLSTRVSTELLFEQVHVSDMTDEFGWTADSDPLIAGSVASPTPANQLAMVITFYTGHKGRSFRGRNYLPGLGESAKDTPLLWNVAALEAVQSDYEDLQSTLSGLGYQMAVLSRVSGGVERTLGIPTDITSIVARLPIYTIRGRIS